MDYTPKLSIVLTMDQYKKLRKYIPWGLKNYFFTEIVDQVINLIESQGDLIIAQVISGEIILTKKEGENVKHRRPKEEYNGNDDGRIKRAVSNTKTGKKNTNKDLKQYKESINLTPNNQSKTS